MYIYIYINDIYTHIHTQTHTHTYTAEDTGGVSFKWGEGTVVSQTADGGPKLGGFGMSRISRGAPLLDIYSQ